MGNYIIREISKEADSTVCKIAKNKSPKLSTKRKVDFKWLNRIIKDKNGQIIAKILSKVYIWNCLYIETLWVEEEHKEDGLDAKLLNEIEKIAQKKGCFLIFVDTFDFQAKNFYEKHGFEIFSNSKECLSEHKKYFMKKAFSPQAY